MTRRIIKQKTITWFLPIWDYRSNFWSDGEGRSCRLLSITKSSTVNRGSRSFSSGYCKSPQASTNTVGSTTLVPLSAPFRTKNSASQKFKQTRLPHGGIILRISREVSRPAPAQILYGTCTCNVIVYSELGTSRNASPRREFWKKTNTRLLCLSRLSWEARKNYKPAVI